MGSSSRNHEEDGSPFIPEALYEHTWTATEQDEMAKMVEQVLAQVDQSFRPMDIKPIINRLIQTTSLDSRWQSNRPTSGEKVDKEEVAIGMVLDKVMRALHEQSLEKRKKEQNPGFAELPPGRRDDAIALVRALQQFYAEPGNVGKPVSEAITICVQTGDLQASDIVKQTVAREYAQIVAQLEAKATEKTQEKPLSWKKVTNVLRGLFPRK